jgi:signal transduction histidine kinase
MESASEPASTSKDELLAEALRKADERAVAGRLALEMIHEIRNPLEALGNLLYLATLQVENPEAARGYLALAEEQIVTVNRIANQTLDFARPLRTPHATDLVGLAEAALRIHQRAIEAKRVHLVKKLPDELVVDVYASEILQVISNMIDNALDALPAEGAIHLRLRNRAGKVEILIADNGHGILKEHIPEIFQPFFTTKDEGGTGLGLALSKNIVERHRGKIRMRSSVRPGKNGTVFRVSLPVRESAK